MWHRDSQRISTVAINLSDRSLEVVKVAHSTNGFTLQALSRLEIEAGIIEDGKIIQASALAEAIKKVLHQAKPLPIRDKQIVLSLPESKVFSFSFEAPVTLKDQELADLIRHRAAEIVPLDPEILIADFQVVRQSKMEVFYAATYKSLLQEYLQVFNSLNIRVSFVGLESQALAAVVSQAEPDQNVLLLDIGARTTIATIQRNNFVRETVSVPIAGDSLTAILAQEKSVNRDEIEQIKSDYGLRLENNPYRELLLQVTDTLVGEIQRFIQYWRSRSADAIQKVIIVGGTSQMPGLTEYFQTKFQVPCVVGELLPTIQLDKARLNVQKFLPVIGAAVLSLGTTQGSINFLKSTQPRSNKKSSLGSSGTLIAAQKPSIPLWRLLVLLLLLLAALAVFGVIWWRSTTPLTPASTSTELIDRNISASFTIDAGSVATSTGVTVAGRLEHRILTEQLPLNARYWQRIIGNARSEGKNINDKQQIYDYVMKDLVGKVWRDNYSSLAGQYSATNNYLLDNYPVYEIVSSSPQVSGFTVNQDQVMTLSIDFTSLAVVRSSLNQLVDTAWQAKYQTPAPSGYQITSTIVKQLPNSSRFEVTMNVFPPVEN